jgi:adenosylcobinamide-GDP ribazoletransferase
MRFAPGGSRGQEGLRLAISLLTVVPVRAGRVDRDSAGQAMALAPVAGVLVGLCAAVTVAVCGWLGFGSGLAAVLAVAAMALLTRGLHLDGLADLADGLGSARPPAEALEIMKRSDIGPFGVVTLILTLSVQIAALSQIPHRSVAVVIAAATGRLAVTWACRTGVPAARADGLGALVAGTVRVPRAVTATMATCVAAALASAVWGARPALLAAAAVLAGVAASALLLRHALRRLGGVTGDVLGALVELSATSALLVLCVAP